MNSQEYLPRGMPFTTMASCSMEFGADIIPPNRVAGNKHLPFPLSQYQAVHQGAHSQYQNPQQVAASQYQMSQQGATGQYQATHQVTYQTVSSPYGNFTVFDSPYKHPPMSNASNAPRGRRSINGPSAIYSSLSSSERCKASYIGSHFHATCKTFSVLSCVISQISH